MYQEVDRLFDVVSYASRRLPPEKLASYLQRLANPKKHEDALVEFAPILRLHSSATVAHEVPGLGEGNTTVDWVIADGEGPPVCLDVKNRTKDLLESFVRLHAGERSPDGTAPAPAHDHDFLFKSVVQKFKRGSPADAIHAVWIKPGLMQEESELRLAFQKLDRQRVHVALIGDWEDDVYVVTNNDEARSRTLQILQVRESKRWVFPRDGG